MRRDPRCLLALAGAIALAATASAGSSDEADLKRWLEGPVRYIISPDEIKQYKRLETDDQRAAAIERFWARRDPTPATWVNEYRQAFWQRVKETNDNFTDTPGPGWKTDRGKIYILYGPPDETREDINADVTGYEATSSRGLLRWIYSSRAGGRRDIDPVVVVPFVRDAAGQYRLSNDPQLASIFFEWSSLQDRHSPVPWERWFATVATGERSRLGVMLDLGKLQEVPPQEQVLLERVETVETYRSKPLAFELDLFEPPGATGSLVIATMALGPIPEGEQPGLVVRFAPRDATRRPRILAEGSFRVQSAGTASLAQGRAILEPGIWDVTALAVDPGAEVNRVWRGSITVPERRPTLHLSDVVLAASLEPLEYAQLVSYDAPFIVGAFRVVPRVGGAVPRGEPVGVFLEVYGGRPGYRVAFQLEGQEDDGRWTTLGAPQTLETASSSAGWSLATRPTWPLGAYRVTVTAEDAEGSVVRSIVPLTLVAPDAP